jgi:hypothetical protein
MVRNGLPGAMHARLNDIVGTWRVEKSLFIAGGTPEAPLVSRDLVCRREWIVGTGKRYLQDVTEGTLGEGRPYYRMGVLGYSTMDRRYEWNTVDAMNSNMMFYAGRSDDPAAVISMAGEFTDQGVLGEESVGRNVGMRTVIRIESADRHVFELHLTPSGGAEILADRSVYTRVR